MKHILPEELRLIGVIAVGLFFFTSYDILQWVPLIAADMAFMGVTALFVGSLVFALTCREKKAAHWILALVMLVLVVLTRPAYPPFLIMAIISVLFFNFTQMENPKLRATALKRFLICLAFFIPLFLASYSYFLIHTYEIVAEWNLPKIWIFVHGWFNGMILDNRPELNHGTPHTILDYTLIILDRLRWFFAITIEGFNPLHTVTQFIYYLPPTALCFVAIHDTFDVEDSMPVAMWMLTFICTSVITLTAFYVACLFMSDDWRYRVAVIPEFIMLAGIGAVRVFGRLKKHGLVRV